MYNESFLLQSFVWSIKELLVLSILWFIFLSTGND